ncbi:hypothetical protein ABMA28_003402 [Loxostege sticticalis]|uniref:Uncharacterized protein n=1 Tax=Loxostege sticticalis TaxID=481309 RepID=A0ABD0SW08_LOXSC
MESKLALLLLLVCVAYAAGQGSSQSSGSDDDNDYSYPCSLDDLNCVRNYFAQSGMCSKVSHEDGETVQSEKLVCFTPKFNASYTCLDDSITFYGSKLKEFYVNTKSNNLVMSVSFEAINLYTPKAIVDLQVSGQEDVVVETYINVTYSVVLTLIVPNAGRDGLARASVTSYNTNAVPPFAFGTEVTESSNEVIKNFWNALVQDVATAVQELFLTKGRYLAFIYLQSYICDYGVQYTGELY